MENLVEISDPSGGNAASQTGHVHFVGAGPGDPELLTVKALRLLQAADVVIHDRLVSDEILEPLRKSATKVLSVGKTAFGPSWKQDDINALVVLSAISGADVVRLKGGDPAIFGRLDEEVAALEVLGIPYDIVPGITAASAGAAAIGQSLSKRGRNSSFRILTAHDVDGFAENDWRDLAKPGSTAAVYMGVRASKFLRGRLLMFGASGAMPVTAIENASRAGQRVIATCLMDLPQALVDAAPDGPVVILLGLEPRAALAAASNFREAL
jgi:uroporphyrin-III C-methyltransferase/precorrin-2 dehydrogenase/sirohydrochlorin ferrochelatase